MLIRSPCASNFFRRFGALAACVAVIAAGLAAASAPAAAAQEGPTQSDVLLRDQLIAQQENLLNAYRCLYNTDTELVPGNCPNFDPTPPGQFTGVPTQQDIALRDQLIETQEALLNAYRCLFNVDTHIVPGNCSDSPPRQPETPAPSDRAALEALYNAAGGSGWRSDTNWLSSRPLGQWRGVTTDANGRVTRLNLNNNDLSGAIPAELGNLTQLQQLRLFDNELSGAIPAELGNLAQLQYLSLGNNQLRGAIPAELGNLAQLQQLRLYGNSGLSGALPAELGNLTQLQQLRLYGNSGLSGALPISFTRLEALRWLHLSGTGLCAPAGAAFQQWLSGVGTKVGVVDCAPASDRAALEALYNAAGGSGWRSDTNWLSSRPLGQWRGVTTDANGRVTRLVLGNNELNGQIPAELGNLTQLQYLSLGNNQLRGAIPSELGNLTQLTQLWLNGNELSGAIPSELGNLTQLTQLRLNGNELSGAIPPELGNLAQLQQLRLYGNSGLSGALPISFTRLEALRWLHLSGTGLCAPAGAAFQQWLSGVGAKVGVVDCAPASDRAALEALYRGAGGAGWDDSTNWLSSRPLGQWHGVTTDANGRVTRLNLNNNDLSGAIPAELGNLTQLQQLLLFDNELRGAIPAELGNLAQLQYLSLGNNQLRGAIPAELGNLAQLQQLRLYGNSGLSGALPGSFTRLEALGFLHLSGTGLCAPAGAAFQQWLSGVRTKVGVVACAPASDRAALEALYNTAGGSNWRTSTNWLSSKPLGQWHGVTTDANGRVTRLVLQSNELSGAIPSELGNLTQLTQLWLNGNELSGAIPPELGNLTQLTHLTLGSNELSGAIPAELGNLTQLTHLTLGSNSGLSGAMPISFTRLEALRWLHLSGTGLCAPTAAAFQQWLSGVRTKQGVVACAPASDRAALEALYNTAGGSNWRSSTNWLSSRPLGQWHGVTTDANGRVTRLVLQSNELSGAIPSELGNLTQLTQLWLNGNELSGAIPPELGNLTQLTHLTLGSNELSGAIPAELGNLTQLTHLTLGSNSGLSGAMPISFTRLEALRWLHLSGTGLCAPTAAAFQQWLSGVRTKQGVVACAPASDRAALEALYNTAGGSNWRTSTNWLSSKPLGQWHGVTTDANGRVTRLDLNNNDLSGTIPAELGNLTQLQQLSLRGNSGLSGALPISFTRLEALSSLNLSGTGLCAPTGASHGLLGGIFRGWLSGVGTKLGVTDCAPAQSTDRAALEALYRAAGGSSWDDSTNWLTSKPLGQWHGVTTDANGRVTRLNLNNNQLSGAIPAELGNLAQLQQLRLYGNELSGAIPAELGNLTQLQQLRLYGNELSGPIPAELGNLTQLQQLRLYGNELSGPIPAELGNLTQLTHLWLNNNELSGAIPAELGNLAQLQQLWLFTNSGLSGALPGSFTGLGALSSLNLSGTGLCAPTATAFQQWLSGVGSKFGVVDCAPRQSTDQAALEALYRAAGGSSWDDSTNWLSSKPLGQWHGVTTDANGHVTRLNLSLNELSGQIPAELGNLAQLANLSLYGNELSGAIPPELGNLTQLQQLWLFTNSGLSGALPGSFTGLGALSSLNLSGTGLCAPTTAAFQQWLSGVGSKLGVTDCAPAQSPDRAALEALYRAAGGSSWDDSTNWLTNKPLGHWHGVTTDANGRVTRLNLNDNELNGQIPAELGNLTQLQHLYLNNNQLSRAIPAELGNLTQLQYLVLNSNELNGQIPAELGNLTRLQHLWLYDNQLSGAIPAELGNLTRLQHLWLYDNQLSGAIPAELGNLTKLTHLSFGNNELSGAIPTELGNLAQLLTLVLSGNSGLSGALPGSFTGLRALSSLNLSRTALCAPTAPAFQQWLSGIRSKSGVVNCDAADRAALEALYRAAGGSDWRSDTNWLTSRPLGHWHGVTTDANGRVTLLNLNDNGLSGQIPAELGNLTQLQQLTFYNNQLSGAIPAELGNLTQLQQLTFYNNQLSGAIPAELGNLTQLQQLRLDNNQLSGAIPAELGNLTQLQQLRLDNNQLSWAIPARLGNLTQLTHLWLDNNQLSGAIPARLGNLTQLQHLWLDNNQLSWAIPAEIGNLTQLTHLWLDNNQLSGAIPAEIGNLTQLTHLSLSVNQLSGAIPAEIGNLTQLTQLWLDNNQLSGAIPARLGNLTQLTHLSLSVNQLSGAIPAEIGNLTQLQRLLLYNNELSGAIPAEIGNLTQLTGLLLSDNELSGAIPARLGNLTQLTGLTLGDNSELSGALPRSFTGLEALDHLSFYNTRLCAPTDTAFQQWLSGVGTKPGVVNCDAADRAALEALYRATGGAGWDDSTNWLSSKPLGQWHGVSTDYNGHVTGLDLRSNQLAGHIPAELGNLAQLRHLWLGDNLGLSGALPRSFIGLEALDNLSLYDTGLCAPTDAAFQQWLAGIRSKSSVVNC